MEAGLRKQIACRFGGQKALCLSHESLGSRDFEVLFNNWARKRMGSAELHACPICYTWIVEDLRGTIDEDPLTVLTSSSSGEPGAAHIAFRVKKHVVAHLKVS